MKPLSIIISAFGSYSGETVIDMEKLGENGIYLITGDTGSGKTTIFDAITFALFGEASGSVREKKMFRSKYSSPKQKTFVKLRFLSNGKIYTITRSPEYERPKEKGEGTTKQASEVLLEFSDGRTPLTKEKEVSLSIEEILGINCKQFSQIAMIAQGDFLKLLLADTKERIEIFRNIFNTETYKLFQDKLSLEAKSIEGLYSELKNKIKICITNTKCSYSDELNFKLEEIKKLDVIPDITVFSELLNNIIAFDTEKLEEFEKLNKNNDSELEKLNIKIGEAEIILKAKSDLKSAENVLLQELPSLEILEASLKKAAKEYSFCDDVRKKLGAEQEKLKSYDSVDVLQNELKRLNIDKKHSEDTLCTLKDSHSKALENIKSYKTQLEKLKNADNNLAVLEKSRLQISASLNTVSELLERFKELNSINEKLKNMQNKLSMENEKYKALKSEYDLKQEIFWSNQAGMLALSLKDDTPCPVCGSKHHPSPALISENSPEKNELDNLKNKISLIKNSLDNISSDAANLNGQAENIKKLILRASEAVFDNSPFEDIEENACNRFNELNNEILKIDFLIKEATDMIRHKENLEKLIFELENKLEEIQKEINDVENSLIICNTNIKTTANQIEEIISKLEYKSRAEAEKNIKKLSDFLINTEENYNKSKEAYDICKKQTDETATKILTLKSQILQKEDVDFDELKSRKNVLLKEKEQLISALDELKLELSNNKASKISLSAYSKELKETEKKLTSTMSLSKTVNGTLTGKDRIKFETYVQMRYFERILIRASKRLLKMTDGQYELIRSREQAKGSQNGLEIEVIDHYNGSLRSIKTLSGGEAFKASLSLALALSDEIQEYSGGIKIDTMFIDEGFGSLDDESLNQALSALSDLSQGNRLIGIISHVSELKNRIDKKIIVTKSKSGGSYISIET